MIASQDYCSLLKIQHSSSFRQIEKGYAEESPFFNCSNNSFDRY